MIIIDVNFKIRFMLSKIIHYLYSSFSNSREIILVHIISIMVKSVAHVETIHTQLVDVQEKQTLYALVIFINSTIFIFYNQNTKFWF